MKNYTITKTPKGERVLWCCNWIKGGYEVHVNNKILFVFKTKKEALEYVKDMKYFDTFITQ